METLEQILRHNHTWVLDRVAKLSVAKQHDDAFSIVQEFEEWLDPDANDHAIFSLEYIGEGSEYD
tara:strand:- start:705 stop:899 length:195 start_codon:yes stop_codon:yes gene_type:complete